MCYLFKNVSIYIDIENNLYIIPYGTIKNYKGSTNANAQLDIVIYLKYPYTDYELEEAVIKALDLCHSKEPNIDGVTPLEKFLNVKGYERSVKNKRLVGLRWLQDEGFKITPTQKVPRKGHSHLNDRVIVLGKSLKEGELSKAINKAIDMSII